MYFITCLSFIDRDIVVSTTGEIKTIHNYVDSRCMGYRIKLEDAIGSVKANACDIHECSYKYAVIEEYGEGMYAFPTEIQWYEWASDAVGYVECERPEEAKNMVSFGIG